MSEEKFTNEYINNKYTADYFDKHYTISNNIVIRRPHSVVESQFEKGICLYKCLSHFTNTFINNASNCFECNDERLPDTQTRCCCSQLEEDGLKAYLITHKETGFKFVIGRVCYEKLFGGEKDKLKYFFQQKCLYCLEKVKKHDKNRPNFCNQKCVRKHCEKEQRKKQEEEYKKKEEERKKKWDEEAPKREAEREREKKEWEDGAKQRQIDYSKMLREKEKWCLKNLEKNFKCCQNCEKPKTKENEKKFPLCFTCHNKAHEVNFN